MNLIVVDCISWMRSIPWLSKAADADYVVGVTFYDKLSLLGVCKAFIGGDDPDLLMVSVTVKEKVLAFHLQLCIDFPERGIIFTGVRKQRLPTGSGVHQVFMRIDDVGQAWRVIWNCMGCQKIVVTEHVWELEHVALVFFGQARIT